MYTAGTNEPAAQGDPTLDSGNSSQEKVTAEFTTFSVLFSGETG